MGILRWQGPPFFADAKELRKSYNPLGPFPCIKKILHGLGRPSFLLLILLLLIHGPSFFNGHFIQRSQMW